MEDTQAYPVQYSVTYPDRDLNRLSSAFRIFAAIPILIVVGAVERWGGGYSNDQWSWGASTAGVLFLAPLLMILFRQKYPRWWFDWNLELLRFENRIGAYLALLDDNIRPRTSTSLCGSSSRIPTPSATSPAGCRS